MIAPTFALRGLDAVFKAVDNADKQWHFAAAKALTLTAKAVQADLVQSMRTSFDRPTPYTLRSTFIKPATRDNLVSFVGLKDMLPSKAALSPAEVLRPQFLGGSRRRKNLERYLTSAGYLGANEYVVPGAGARLDAYGNMGRGQVAQIISQLRIGLDPYAWKSKSARSRRNVKKAGRIFWSRGFGRSGHLPRGAWIDLGPPVGLRPLLVVVSAPTYRPRINLAQIAAKTVARTWEPTFEKCLRDALATAR